MAVRKAIVVSSGSPVEQGSSDELNAGAGVVFGTGVIVTESGASRTLADPTDNGKILRFTSGSGVTVYLADSLPVGFTCLCIQMGAGQLTFSTTGSATRRNRQSHTKSAGQYAVVSLVVVANAGSAAEWVLSGDTAS